MSEQQEPSVTAQIVVLVIVLGGCALVARACGLFDGRSTPEVSAVDEAASSPPNQLDPTPVATVPHKEPRVPTEFIAWVKRVLPNPPNGDFDKLECYGPSDPDSGWCYGAKYSSKTMSEGVTMDVRFLKRDPSVIKFEILFLDAGLTCRHFGWPGGQRVSDSLARDRWSCDLSSNSLKGHIAHLVAAKGVGVAIWSPSYGSLEEQGKAFGQAR